MAKHYKTRTNNAFRKVYLASDPGVSTRETINRSPSAGHIEVELDQMVAMFTRNSDGDHAFACFKEGLARSGQGSLFDEETGEYLVGSLEHLDR